MKTQHKRIKHPRRFLGEPKPPATPQELKSAYAAGFENGMLPETMDPSGNPFAWKNAKADRERAVEWSLGWTAGAEEFCDRRDNPKAP